jgi:hypothetical protein
MPPDDRSSAPRAARAPHLATVPRGSPVQPKMSEEASAPHPATAPRGSAVQPRRAREARTPHPATVERSSSAQPKMASGERPPHPAAAQGHAETVQRALLQEANLAERFVLKSTKKQSKRTIMVYVDSHQNKHQSTKIALLKPYDGGKGSTFPDKVDFEYHKSTIAPIVLDWAIKMQGYIMAKAKTNDKAYIPKSKFDLAPDHIDFDVVAVYDADEDVVNVTYHCGPNKNSKPKDF